MNAPADVVSSWTRGTTSTTPSAATSGSSQIIGLDPRSQLVILSATIGDPDRFCQWVYLTRRIEMSLVQSLERRVPLYHHYRENYLIEVAKELFQGGDVPAIVFTFGREACFERARILKSCPRFTTEEERETINRLADEALLDRGLAKELKPLLLHGIGVHHAGILPRYKQLVERLTLERLLKFVVSTETISAGINLPAKRVIFPELRKYVQKKARLLTSAEYHQMAGRAGRPQFDSEGVAITLAPEAVVQEIRKELKDAAKGRFSVDEAKVRRSVYARTRADAAKNNDVTWDAGDHERLVAGKPASLKSQTRITAEQILAIGLPDLQVEQLPGAVQADPLPEGAAAALEAVESSMPASMHLNIRTVIDHLLLEPRERYDAHRRLAMVTANLRAMGIIDEHGAQVTGHLINQLRGIDGLFVYHCLMSCDLDYPLCRELVEFLVDHDVIHRILGRKDEDQKREWMRNRLRERRRDEPQVSWEDVEAEYEQQFPRELGPIEQQHAAFLARLPHPELHGGKKQKKIWALMEEEQLSFMDLVERENLVTEEGNLFSYLIRVAKFAKMLHEATQLDELRVLEDAVRRNLSVIDARVVEEVLRAEAKAGPTSASASPAR